ncbi:MAG: ABC transporter ATP-binding protein [Ignavibacteriales bacterium]|nr:ABC transporter ATP-binding protein [Ignavibacteriales bacterium]
MILSARNIHRRFSTGDNRQLEVLRGISLDFAAGEITAIVGPSGAGKSTFLHIIGLLDRPQEGTVLLNDVDAFSLKEQQLAKLRNKEIGFVFQFHHLLPEFSAVENVMMPALIAGVNQDDAHGRATALLEDVGVAPRALHKPNELSGGEQQRVAVARALMNSPKVVLADEPSGNLDSENASALHSMILELRTKYRQTFVIVTHNRDLAALADRVVTIVDGVVQSEGKQ